MLLKWLLLLLLLYWLLCLNIDILYRVCIHGLKLGYSGRAGDFDHFGLVDHFDHFGHLDDGFGYTALDYNYQDRYYIDQCAHLMRYLDWVGDILGGSGEGVEL